MYNLNRGKISDSIRRFYSFKECPCEVSDVKEKNGTRRRVDIHEKNGDKFFLDFHFKGDGSTSIDYSSGKKMEVKQQIGEFIISDPECALGDVTSKGKWYVAEDIEHNDFKAIIELLIESDFSVSHSLKEFDVFEQHKFNGYYQEQLTIHYYLTKDKVMIQGRPLLLFIEAMSLIAELIDLEEIPNFFNENYEVSIDKNDVEQQYEYYFPNSHDKHPDKLKRVLHQAVYNLQLEGEMFDFTFLVFPALKALEGHLKYILHQYSISLENNRFSMFKKEDLGPRFILYPKYHSQIGNLNLLTYIENTFNFYHRHRNSLFHWSDPTTPIDDTRIIEHIGDSKRLIQDTFKIIDKYYIYTA